MSNTVDRENTTTTFSPLHAALEVEPETPERGSHEDGIEEHLNKSSRKESQLEEGDRSDVAPPPKKDKISIEVTDKQLFPYIVFGGCLLTFNGGFMNCIALTSHMAEVVSHVSGHATKASVELATHSFAGFANEIGVMVFFGVGAMFTGCFIGKEKLTLGQSYGRLLICIGGVVALAMFSGVSMDDQGQRPYHAGYLLAIACGMQNAMTTRYSGAVLRTTHLTGMMTDIGLVLGHMLRKDRNFDDTWKLALFCPMVLCFFFGGSLAVALYRDMGLWALCPSIVLLCGSGVAYIIFIARVKHITFIMSLVRPVLTQDINNTMQSPLRQVRKAARSTRRRRSSHAGNSENFHHESSSRDTSTSRSRSPPPTSNMV